MLDVLNREWVYLWYYFTLQFQQIFGYWVVGILIGSAVSVLGKDRIHALILSLKGKKWGAFGVLPFSALGIASPLCMYGTIPIAASFWEKGVGEDWLAAFMMGSILLNPQLIAYSAALGPAALAVRIASCLLCGAAAGLLVRWCYTRRGKPFFKFTAFGQPVSRDVHPNILWRLVNNIWRNVKATGPYFLLGIALSALFQRYVPESAMTAVFGGNRAFGVLMAATVGVPLYACGGGTIPLIQQWMASGMTLGAAAAFMITGPATKITNLGALKIVLGAKHFVLYIVYCLAFAFLCGLAVDRIL